MTTLLFRLRRDQRAAIAPMIAIFSTSLIGAAGFALDAAVYYVGNRELRAATESAALAAAMDPAHGMARAQTYLARNGYDPAVLKQVEVGRYCASVHLAPAARFDASRALCPGNGLDTAVRIRTEAPSHQYLTRLLGPMNPIPPLSATATAARIDEAGVGVTSGILDVSGITGSLVDSVNRLLGALLGVQLNLGAATVEALMKGDIDAGLFFDKLAARVGETGTYADLVDRTVSLRDLLSAAADAAGNPGTATALNLVAGRVGSGLQVPLQGLFGLGVWKNMPVGYADEKPGLRAGLNAYQLLAYATQRVGGTIDLSSLTGAVVGNSTVRVGTVVTDAMARPSFSFGPAGETIVGTAAVRLQLQVGLPDITILGQTVTANVPVLLEIAPASASVSDIQCPGTAEQAVETRATISAQTGLVSAFIGKVPASKMSRPFGQPVKASDIDPELIAGLRILGLPVGLTAKRHCPISSGRTAAT